MIGPQLWAGLVAVLFGVLVGSFGFAAPASAHAVLTSSTPQQGTVVNAAPSQVVLRFSEAVTLIPGKIRVIAPDQSRADTDEARTSGDEVIIPLRKGGPHGTYLVSYRVISADSHPVAGAYTYSVVTPSTPPSEDAVATSTSSFVTALFPIVRWIGYAGLVLLVGAVLVLALLWPQRLSRTGPTRVIWIGAGAIAVATIAELAVQVAYIAGGFGQIRASDYQEVLSSQYGAAHLIRLGVLAAAMFLVRPIVRGKGWGADRVLLAVLGAIAVATWSVSGHPYASPIPTVTVVADMIHIAAMAVWLGGLAMLVVFVLPQANATELAAIIPVWSRWAAYAVGALVVTGIAQALVEVNSVPALFNSTYGLLVLAKVVLLGLVLLVATGSRRLVGPIAEKSTNAVSRLRRLVAAESVGVLVIVAVASVLVQVTPARTASAVSASNAIQSTMITSPNKLYVLTVDVDPAKVGNVLVHMYASTIDGQPATVKEWTVTAALPAQGIEPIEASVLAVGDNHAIGQITVPAAGEWTFKFTLRTTEIDQDTVSTVFTISG